MAVEWGMRFQLTLVPTNFTSYQSIECFSFYLADWFGIEQRISVFADFSQLCNCLPPYLVFRIFTKDYCIQLAKPQLDANRPKSPPPLFCLLVRYSTHIVAHDITSCTDISCIIEPHFGFCGRKAPSPTRMREKFLTSDLSISGNFKQLWFLWQKSPPPPPKDEGKFFDFRSIHFRQFQATLVFVAEKPPPPSPKMREHFLTSDLSISGNFEQLWFLWQKSPPQDEGTFFDFRSIHFRQFWATLVFVAQKPPPPPKMREIFWLQIYPFQAILSNFGFCGRKAPPYTLISLLSL